MLKRLEELEELVKNKPQKVIGVAAAEDSDIMQLVKALESRHLARFILTGNQTVLAAMLDENGISQEYVELINCKDSKDAARTVVTLAREGRCDLVMKGNLHTSVFLKSVLDKECGLNAGKMLSQITVYNRKDAQRLQIMTDCAMAIAPDLNEKKHIIENAVELMQKLGYECPKVALVCALELVNPKMPDTIDAAILSKMCDRGQIAGCIVDGPLAFDNAISKEAAAHKGISSPVAGDADILVFPNLQVANCVFKSMVYFADLYSAAVIMGAQMPVVMTSRTDTVQNKLISILMAIYLAGKF